MSGSRASRGARNRRTELASVRPLPQGRGAYSRPDLPFIVMFSTFAPTTIEAAPRFGPFRVPP